MNCVGRVISIVIAAVLGANPMLHALCEASCAHSGHEEVAAAAHDRPPASMPTHEVGHHHTGAEGPTQAAAAPPHHHNHPTSSAATSGHTDFEGTSAALASESSCCVSSDAQLVSVKTARAVIVPPAVQPTGCDLDVAVLSDSSSVRTVRALVRPPIPASLSAPLRV
jgi:hypothetical protein